MEVLKNDSSHQLQHRKDILQNGLDQHRFTRAPVTDTIKHSERFEIYKNEEKERFKVYISPESILGRACSPLVRNNKSVITSLKRKLIVQLGLRKKSSELLKSKKEEIVALRNENTELRVLRSGATCRIENEKILELIDEIKTLKVHRDVFINKIKKLQEEIRICNLKKEPLSKIKKTNIKDNAKLNILNDKEKESKDDGDEISKIINEYRAIDPKIISFETNIKTCVNRKKIIELKNYFYIYYDGAPLRKQYTMDGKEQNDFYWPLLWNSEGTTWLGYVLPIKVCHRLASPDSILSRTFHTMIGKNPRTAGKSMKILIKNTLLHLSEFSFRSHLALDPIWTISDPYRILKDIGSYPNNSKIPYFLQLYTSNVKDLFGIWEQSCSSSLNRLEGWQELLNLNTDIDMRNKIICATETVLYPNWGLMIAMLVYIYSGKNSHLMTSIKRLSKKSQTTMIDKIILQRYMYPKSNKIKNNYQHNKHFPNLKYKCIKSIKTIKEENNANENDLNTKIEINEKSILFTSTQANASRGADKEAQLLVLEKHKETCDKNKKTLVALTHKNTKDLESATIFEKKRDALINKIKNEIVITSVESIYSNPATTYTYYLPTSQHRKTILAFRKLRRKDDTWKNNMAIKGFLIAVVNNILHIVKQWDDKAYTYFMTVINTKKKKKGLFKIIILNLLEIYSCNVVGLVFITEEILRWLFWNQHPIFNKMSFKYRNSNEGTLKSISNSIKKAKEYILNQLMMAKEDFPTVTDLEITANTKLGLRVSDFQARCGIDGAIEEDDPLLKRILRKHVKHIIKIYSRNAPHRLMKMINGKELRNIEGADRDAECSEMKEIIDNFEPSMKDDNMKHFLITSIETLKVADEFPSSKTRMTFAEEKYKMSSLLREAQYRYLHKVEYDMYMPMQSFLSILIDTETCFKKGQITANLRTSMSAMFVECYDRLVNEESYYEALKLIKHGKPLPMTKFKRKLIEFMTKWHTPKTDMKSKVTTNFGHKWWTEAVLINNYPKECPKKKNCTEIGKKDQNDNNLMCDLVLKKCQLKGKKIASCTDIQTATKRPVHNFRIEANLMKTSTGIKNFVGKNDFLAVIQKDEMWGQIVDDIWTKYEKPRSVPKIEAVIHKEEVDSYFDIGPVGEVEFRFPQKQYWPAQTFIRSQYPKIKDIKNDSQQLSQEFIQCITEWWDNVKNTDSFKNLPKKKKIKWKFIKNIIATLQEKIKSKIKKSEIPNEAKWDAFKRKKNQLPPPQKQNYKFILGVWNSEYLQPKLDSDATYAELKQNN